MDGTADMEANVAQAGQSGNGPAPLGKGTTLPLFKGKRITAELVVDLAWDLVSDAEEDYDLDLSAFLVTRAGTVPHNNRFYCVYYNNERSADNSTYHHTATMQPGEVTDDEIVYVHLSQVHDDVDKIMLVVSIYDGDVLGHTFQKMTKATVTISGEIMGGRGELETIATDTIAGHYEGMTAVVIGEIHRAPRTPGGWEYRRIDRGFPSLVEVGKLYGVDFR
jgi:tellurium resistance protein TerD